VLSNPGQLMCVFKALDQALSLKFIKVVLRNKFSQLSQGFTKVRKTLLPSNVDWGRRSSHDYAFLTKNGSIKRRGFPRSMPGFKL
jgi:hypothetical protein